MKPGIIEYSAAHSSARHRSSPLYLMACPLFVLLFCLAAYAQYRAGIQGIVTDPEGAVVPEASVTVTSNETNISHTTKTSGGGAYAITGLAPGSYRVTVEKEGFSKKVLSDVVVQGEQLHSLNLGLAVGEVSQSVTVSETTVPLLDSESALVGGTITHKEVEDLPSFGRDPFKLLRLTPGVFGDGAQSASGGTTQMPGVNRPSAGASDSIFFIENGPQIIANGTRQNSNNIQVDGVGLNSVSWGGSSVLTPNEESIKEIQVVANNYSAENGRNSGAQISVISQNGTNKFHGSGFFKWHRPGLDAYQRWNGPGTPSPVTRDNNRFNQFGGSVGGPVWKNKLFFFFSYEGLRNRANTTKIAWFETPQYRQLAGRSGSLARNMLSFPAIAPLPGTLSTLTCAQVGLPSTQCHDVAGGLDLGSPLTNALGTRDPTFNTTGRPWGIGNGFDGIPDVIRLVTPAPTKSVDAQYNGRLDFHPTDKDLVAFSIYWVPTTTNNINGPARGIDLWNSDRLSQSWTGIWDRTFSSTIINEARFGLSAWKFDETKTNSQAPFGLPPANIDSAGAVSVQKFGAPNPGLFNQSFWTAHDTLSKSYKNHFFKIGGDFSRARFVDANPGAARPTYSFHNLWDYANDAPFQESGNFDPATGMSSDNKKILHYSVTALFFQDDWKVRPNFTLNLGLRWEYYSPLTAEHGRLSTPVLGAGTAVLTGLKIKTGGDLTSTSKQNFGPQLGIAWSPSSFFGHEFNNRLVLRGGFGIGYNLQQLSTLSNGRSNPPFITSLTLSGTNILYGAPSDPFQFFGYPANPAAKQTFDPNTGLPIGGAPVNLTGFPATEETPTTYRYSLDAQYNLGRNWVATLGYQGSQTRHYQRQTDLSLVYYPNLNSRVNKLSWYPNEAAAHYNALLSQIYHRFSTQFSIDAQYRYSKNFDQGSTDFYMDQYPFTIDASNGPADYDVRHDLKIWGVYTPTIFRGSRGWLEKLVGGWTLSGIMDIHSGFPWTPTYNTRVSSGLVYSGGGKSSGYTTLRPAFYNGGAGTDYSNSTFMRPNGNFPNGALAYFGVPVFSTTGIPPAPGVGRNTFRGPHYFGLDGTIAKAFGLPKMPVLGEGARLNLQLNAYNVFNKLNLNPTPNTSISNDGVHSNPQFGQSQGALAGRIVEMQARFSF